MNLNELKDLPGFVTDGVCYALGVTVDTDDHWSSQINRLQQLIDKLECQVSTSDHALLTLLWSFLCLFLQVSICLFAFLVTQLH